MAEGRRRRAGRRAAHSRGGARRRRLRSRSRPVPRRSAFVTAVSATSTVRPRACTSETPITRWPGLGSMTRRTSSSDDRVVARDAGHHGVGVAERHHAGGEDVAVLVDQALAVAEQEALALQALVEKVRIVGVALRKPRIVDFDARRGVSSRVLGRFAHAAPRGRSGSACRALMDEARGGADHLLLLALGEDDALGLAPHAARRRAAGRRRSDRAARESCWRIGVHVDDRLARDAGIHRRLGDRGRDGGDQARIERHRDDVVRARIAAARPDRRRRPRRARPRAPVRPAPGPRRSSSPR